jgi:hypothetical protein
MTRRPRLDPLAAVASAQAEVDRLHERREASLEGKGPAPHPSVIAAAEAALEKARGRLRKAVAA